MALPVGWGSLTHLYAALHIGGPLGIPHPCQGQPFFFGESWIWGMALGQ